MAQTSTVFSFKGTKKRSKQGKIVVFFVVVIFCFFFAHPYSQSATVKLLCSPAANCIVEIWDKAGFASYHAELNAVRCGQ